MAGIQKDKLSLKTIYNFGDNDNDQKSSSTRNMAKVSPIQKDLGTPSRRKGNLQKLHKQNKAPSELPKSIPKAKEESLVKSNLVIWENPIKKQPQDDEKTIKSSLDTNQLKRGSSYYYFTPKATHSVERNSLKLEKGTLYHSYKSSLLPSLKLPTNSKKGKN